MRNNLLQVNDHMCFALYSASLAMTKAYQPLLKTLHLTYPQYMAMVVLWERQTCCVSELAGVLFLDTGTITPLLKRLEKLGFISRARCSDDERKVYVALTSAGKALQKTAAEVPNTVQCKTGCTNEKISQLNQDLMALRAALLNK